ncbi:MAG: DUF4280 domain-containing protein [Planctomycetaceae bacterium]
MAQLVVLGAQTMCTYGDTPCVLVVPPAHMTNGNMVPTANIMDHKPIENLPTFGMCSSMSNPQVAAATAANKGVLNPQPCVPNTTSPWTPGCPTVMVGNQPALNNTSQCMCGYGGVITVSDPGQATVNTA